MKKLFCIIFALVSVSLASAQEMSDSLYRAGEQMAYRKYAKSRTRLDSIANGMEYVNTYVIRSERRREVSDRIAYLMASTPEYLAGTSLEVLLSYVYNEDTREYVIRQKTKEEREAIHIEKIRSLGFNAGIGAAVETCEYINEDLADTEYIYGGHLLFSIGDNRNFFNFEIGARYRYWTTAIPYLSSSPAGRAYPLWASCRLLRPAKS